MTLPSRPILVRLGGLWFLCCVASCGSSPHTDRFHAPNPEAAAVRETTDSSDHALGYYETISETQGQALRSQLNHLISKSRRISYNSLWQALMDTDQDPNQPGSVQLIYSGLSLSKKYTVGAFGGKKGKDSQRQSWNREHVWPFSRGLKDFAPNGKTDLHHIRAELEALNSLRGNKDFDEGGDENANFPGTFERRLTFEPRDIVKGDVARMLFYVAVRYYGEGAQKHIDLENTVKGGGPILGRLCTLLKWHLNDPVDAGEVLRNEKIFKTYQGNRNPFIDHPEWAEAIWGGQCE